MGTITALPMGTPSRQGRSPAWAAVRIPGAIVQGENLFGDAVNIAARLEALAEPGGISISRVVRDQTRDKLPYRFEDIGEQSVKDITRPVRAYAMNAAASRGRCRTCCPECLSLRNARRKVTRYRRLRPEK